jgi:hypothetical protein
MGEAIVGRRGKRFPLTPALFGKLVQRIEPVKQSNKKKEFIEKMYKEMKRNENKTEWFKRTTELIKELYIL